MPKLWTFPVDPLLITERVRRPQNSSRDHGSSDKVGVARAGRSRNQGDHAARVLVVRERRAEM
eukprot:6042642-Heterocapsa_arctica.AAC.1